MRKHQEGLCVIFKCTLEQKKLWHGRAQLGLLCCSLFNSKFNGQNHHVLDILTSSFQVSNLQKISWKVVFTPVE